MDENLLPTAGESAWLARVAHEARNPLFGIAASCRALRGALEDGGDASAATAALERIETEVRRLKALLDELLEMGRSAPARLVGKSLGSLLTSAVEAARERHAALAPCVDLDVAPDVQEVAVDEVRVAQVFANLLDNALLSAPGVRVRVSARRSPEGNVVEIEDDGPGFTEEARRRAFEPFFSTRPGGTGLGLVVARHTMEAHGGTLQLVEAPSGGGRVRLLFPA
ncbi:MAG TPA: HAMP domain-containing sensor histidine kinase [Thermoanaerobaculia bacterium]|nr:HAMP domain-containing sensor histidine kinase [Thermoanaerobaculia bacterium]